MDNPCQTQEKNWQYSFNGRGIVTPYTLKKKKNTHHGYQWITLVQEKFKKKKKERKLRYAKFS